MYQDTSHEFPAGNNDFNYPGGYQGYGDHQDINTTNICVSAAISASCIVMNDHLPGSHLQQQQQQQQQQQHQQQHLHHHHQLQEHQQIKPFQLQADDNQHDVFQHHAFPVQSVHGGGNDASFQMEVSGHVYGSSCHFDPPQPDSFLPPAGGDGSLYDSSCSPFDFNLPNSSQGCCPNVISWQQGSDCMATDDQQPYTHQQSSAAALQELPAVGGGDGGGAGSLHGDDCRGNAAAGPAACAPAVYHEMKTPEKAPADPSWSSGVSDASSEVDVDYMISKGVTVGGFKPRPLIRKRKKTNVPENTKSTENYKERRQKNNDSARRSREAKKEKERNFYKRAIELEYENYYLKERISWLESQLALVNSTCT